MTKSIADKADFKGKGIARHEETKFTLLKSLFHKDINLKSKI